MVTYWASLKGRRVLEGRELGEAVLACACLDLGLLLNIMLRARYLYPSKTTDFFRSGFGF